MSEIKRGQTISFRVPSDTPDHLLKHLDALKKQERRNFSSKIAEYVMGGLGQSYQRKRESITVPLPHQLSKAQRDWLKHEHSEALLGSIVYHILADPVRATSLLASMNSNALNIDEALYLQEENAAAEVIETKSSDEPSNALQNEKRSVDMDSIDWEAAMKNERDAAEETAAVEEEADEPDLDDLLGDFLSKMNK